MTQLVIGGPLGELHLRDQFRLDPVRALVGLWTHAERARRPLERLQQLPDARQLAFVEASARVADVHEIVVFVHAKEQRTEV